MQEKHLNLSAGIASVSVATILVIAKIWALSATGSLSIAASLADSAMDFLVASGGLLAIWYASRPPDEDHTFGHTSAEDLAALGQSIFILVSGGVIAVTSVRRLLSPAPLEMTSEAIGIGVMTLSIVLTIALVLWQKHVARRTRSKVVSADSLHYLGDLVPNIGAIAALLASSAFGFDRLDSVVALGAAAILVFGALNIGKSAWDALMDRAAPQEMVDEIGEMAQHYPGVYAYHDLKTRMAGSKPFVNIHIEVNGDQTLREAHAISAGLKRVILETYPDAEVIIHKDVAGEAD
ncbi:cation diffusion facilitator family transporter [Celeribacter persicus]|jgi:cation diffusion facilitator family transporter|uniref:Ferrous-iron efflux pump FieF n=1 Tax=Celeribacter persicus TaxID=1651082 RepID=A0A2T5HGT6_9RHOB|nr:cation diffusion facilitator family transporter [Celeribacter persicus]PTQ70774.1 ferrous-iron efflux pump FieF [Celeribacter persicus]